MNALQLGAKSSSLLRQDLRPVRETRKDLCVPSLVPFARREAAPYFLRIYPADVQLRPPRTFIAFASFRRSRIRVCCGALLWALAPWPPFPLPLPLATLPPAVPRRLRLLAPAAADVVSVPPRDGQGTCWRGGRPRKPWRLPRRVAAVQKDVLDLCWRSEAGRVVGRLLPFRVLEIQVSRSQPLTFF